ncbi:hypothetical protein GB937_005423 [Aspergillus fischeri]|nr:hypothetical protein GB937_005423 [Aspergillus fischeri]
MIVDNPRADFALVTAEQFGPIIPCMPFSDIDAVIAAANSTSTGLSASVWGQDTETTQRIADSLDVGTDLRQRPFASRFSCSLLGS